MAGASKAAKSTATKSVGGAAARPSFLAAVGNAEVLVALGLVMIILMMIIPLPPVILDMLLSVSISLALMILLISVYIREPLEFSTFPTLLLLTTLFRLGLNVATTRSILLNGATGNVSRVVQGFGEFVVGGNYFVGAVLFTILVVINFVVITKGASRVAEVGARFTLDAMPGKQMAIDAEVASGQIDREEARRRRSKIELEADFYGAMDGASKYVRGDAIAGLIITGINIIVGLLLGVVRYNLSIVDAAQKFTLFTVGEGLVSQIPALIISVAAGIVATRAGGDKGLSEELHSQFFRYPKALYISCGLLGAFAIVPGMPFFPFLSLATGAFFLARYASRELALRNAATLSVETEKTKGDGTREEAVEELLRLDLLALEVGVELVPLVDTAQDGEVLQRVVTARKQFAQDIGIIVPMVMIRDNIQLRPDEYQILLKGNVIGRGRLHPKRYLAMDAGDVSEKVKGIDTKEPAYGLDASWILPGERDQAAFLGYTVVNCATVIVTHLTKLIQEHAHELIGRQDVFGLVEALKRQNEKVLEEVIATDRLSLGDVVKVLQNLLAEAVSVRDLLTIFETLADHCKNIRHPDALTRHVRKALRRGIIKKYLTSDGTLVVMALDRAVEDLLIAGVQPTEDGGTSFNLDPQLAQRLLNQLSDSMRAFEPTGTPPVLLCGPSLRWELRKFTVRFLPVLVVLAFDEVPPDVTTQTVATVTL